MTAKKQTSDLAKQKAVEIFDKFHNYTLTDWDKKQCALIAVDEVLKALRQADDFGDYYRFYEQVRSGIEKL